MPIYRKPDRPNWWIDIRLPNGKRIRRSTGTENRRQAQEYHDRIKAELWQQEKLDKEPERTFADAAIRVLQLSEGQKDYATKVLHIQYWREIFSGRTLCSLTSEEIINNLPTHRLRREGDKRKPAKLAPATKNRYLATMSRIMTVAEDVGWIVKRPKLEKFKEKRVRVRWITRDEARSLLNNLTTPWMRDVSAFALATGARMGEILNLEWRDVDLSKNIAWVRADKAKSGRARPLPLNSDALNILNSRTGRDGKWVFTRDTGTHTTDINRRSFNLAAKKSGIKDFHFHDLRHTWASWHIQAGTPLFVLKEMGGWENLEMVKKYAHLNADHLAIHANVVTFWSPQVVELVADNKKAAGEAA